MRLTTITIAFIFFGTVFATPIFPLRGNAVELSVSRWADLLRLF
jgi:hypothetical protein